MKNKFSRFPRTFGKRHAKNLFRNKIGADKILSVYWFAILFIIATGIFAMVYVFYKTPFDVRGIEAETLASKVAECISKQGEISSEWIKGQQIATDMVSCSTEQECQKITGAKLVGVIGGIKNQLAQDIDDSVKKEGVAENFECLILEIAMHESSLQHCDPYVDNSENPLYCDGNKEKAKRLNTDDEDSLGILQVNTKVHDVDSENFEKGIVYAVQKILIPSYDKNEKYYGCKNANYRGGERAIRNYNGWNTDCTKGDNNYVENVIKRKEYIQTLFPEFCSPETIVYPTKSDLQKECNLNFKSEFDKGQYYIQVDFYNLATFETGNINEKSVILSKPITTIFDGNENLKADCEIQKEKDFEKQSKCSEGRFYAIDEDNKPYVVRILSAVRKTEKNVI